MVRAVTQPPFYIGLSTSSYHTEGENIFSDWHVFEQEHFAGDASQMCGSAVDYWNRWRQDNAVLTELGVNAFRTSVEWSRLEPQEGVFDKAAMQTYREIFSDLRQRGMTVFVTMFHYVMPHWFAEKGGFAKKENIRYFIRFVDTVLEELSDVIDVVIPANEIFVYASLGYLLNHFPPRQSNPLKAFDVAGTLIRAHFAVAELIEARGYPCKISSAEQTRTFLYEGTDIIGRTMVGVVNYLFNHAVTRSLAQNTMALPFGLPQTISRKPHRALDFVGIQVYPSVRVRRASPFSLRLVPAGHTTWQQALMDSQWDPASLGAIVEEFARYGTVIISELGIQTERDEERVTQIAACLSGIKRQLYSGVLKGVLYFTLFDCFEWTEGYTRKFGLVGIDRAANNQRIPKPSYHAFRQAVTDLLVRYRKR